VFDHGYFSEFGTFSISDWVGHTPPGRVAHRRARTLRELHRHPHAPEWQYYLKGSARMTVFGSYGRARTDDFSVGDVGYVPQGYGQRHLPDLDGRKYRSPARDRFQSA
jgi:hypothetical protein